MTTPTLNPASFRFTPHIGPSPAAVHVSIDVDEPGNSPGSGGWENGHWKISVRDTFDNPSNRTVLTPVPYATFQVFSGMYTIQAVFVDGDGNESNTITSERFTIRYAPPVVRLVVGGPGASDANNGTTHSPLATLGRALEIVSGADNALISLRSGEIPLGRSLSREMGSTPNLHINGMRGTRLIIDRPGSAFDLPAGRCPGLNVENVAVIGRNDIPQDEMSVTGPGTCNNPNVAFRNVHWSRVNSAFEIPSSAANVDGLTIVRCSDMGVPVRRYDLFASLWERVLVSDCNFRAGSLTEHTIRLKSHSETPGLESRRSRWALIAYTKADEPNNEGEGETVGKAAFRVYGADIGIELCDVDQGYIILGNHDRKTEQHDPGSDRIVVSFLTSYPPPGEPYGIWVCDDVRGVDIRDCVIQREQAHSPTISLRSRGGTPTHGLTIAESFIKHVSVGPGRNGAPLLALHTGTGVPTNLRITNNNLTHRGALPAWQTAIVLKDEPHVGLVVNENEFNASAKILKGGSDEKPVYATPEALNTAPFADGNSIVEVPE